MLTKFLLGGSRYVALTLPWMCSTVHLLLILLHQPLLTHIIMSVVTVLLICVFMGNYMKIATTLRRLNILTARRVSRRR